MLLAVAVLGVFVLVMRNGHGGANPKTPTTDSPPEGTLSQVESAQPASEGPGSIRLPDEHPPDLEGPAWGWQPGEGTALTAYLRWFDAWSIARLYRFDPQQPGGLANLHAALGITDWEVERIGPLPEPPPDWKDRMRRSDWGWMFLPEDYLAARETHYAAVRASNQAHQRWLAELDATGQKPRRG